MQAVLSETKANSFSFVLEGPLTILAVDDDPIQREFCAVYLASPQTEIITAGSALEALQMLEERRFDMALLDVDMPGMNGIDLLRQLRTDTRFNEMPVMMITGREDMTSIDQAYEAGATAFMCKPVNWRLLSHQVKFLLRAHKALQRVEDNHG